MSLLILCTGKPLSPLEGSYTSAGFDEAAAAVIRSAAEAPSERRISPGNRVVYIGEDAVIKAEPDSSWKEGAPDAAPGVALKDGPVTIGIRPEGFDPEKDGELRCGLTAVEVMGRDTSIVATNAHAANGSIRTIVSTEELSEVSGETVNFRIKPSRIYLFDHETGARVRCRFTPLR